jgi:8-oxo-dGTP pyrophosphatase MutT (NUDIX family)
VRDSSTVLLLRKGPSGLEVFMVRRRLKSDFVGGAYVFPGGTLDATDSSGGLLNRLQDVSAEEWGLRLHLPGSQAGAHLVAAIRETFEEAGILLATPRNSGNATSQISTRFWQTQRQALLTGQIT